MAGAQQVVRLGERHTFTDADRRVLQISIIARNGVHVPGGSVRQVALDGPPRESTDNLRTVAAQVALEFHTHITPTEHVQQERELRLAAFMSLTAARRAAVRAGSR